MKLALGVTAAITVLVGGIMFATAGWNLPPVESKQVGYRGTGMVVINDRDRLARTVALNQAPATLYEADPKGPRAKELYPNLQLLGDLSEDQFNRLMASFSEWVGGEQGCAYCHNTENMGDYSRYQMVVARRMIQMTRTINSQWRNHVVDTGVTCYTCHQGKPVPANIWFKEPGPGPIIAGKAGVGESGWMGFRNGQNIAAINTAGSTSLPYDSFSEYLLGDRPIRITANTALPKGQAIGTMAAEHTYALMINMSNGIGQNCVFCHNSRAFNSWEQSPPQRVTAWHGIRMARALNQTYLEPLKATLPAERLGPLLDAPKVNCATCHHGQNKPLNGVSMLKDFMTELGGRTP
jgi:photosynthetic reaction center cytochrome c subunit